MVQEVQEVEEVQEVNDNSVVTENDAVIDSTLVEIGVVKFEDYTAINVVEQLAVYFVPVLILIAGYVMMRILSMRVERL